MKLFLRKFIFFYLSICLYYLHDCLYVGTFKGFSLFMFKKVFKTIRFFKLCFAHSSAIKITYTCITGIKNVNGYNKSNRQHSLRNSIGRYQMMRVANNKLDQATFSMVARATRKYVEMVCSSLGESKLKHYLVVCREIQIMKKECKTIVLERPSLSTCTSLVPMLIVEFGKVLHYY